MKRFSLLLCACIFLTAVYVNGNEILSQECLKKYLKDRHVQDDILDYVDNYVGSISDCESAVRTKLASHNENLRNSLLRRDSRPNVECVMRDIEEEDEYGSYENIILLKTAVEMISGWRFWKYYSKSSRLDELSTEAENIVTKSLLKCIGHRVFGDMFTNIIEKNIVWHRSGDQEFCIRKTLVEKNLLSPELYNFSYNPKNVRTETLSCTDIFKGVLDEYYTDVQNITSDCFLKVYREKGYAEYVLKAEVLSKLTMTPSNKSKERQSFINNMVDISYHTKKC